MALVLRKVVPKNISLLKCMKGRPLATVSNKKNAAPFSWAAARRNYKSKSIPTAILKIRRTKQLVPIQFHSSSKSSPAWVSASCPNLVGDSKRMPLKCFSSGNLSINRSKCLTHFTQQRLYSKGCNVGCPCPFPCGPCGCKDGCNCLPPPCNTPPRCIQYMTGYYYYPYGTWFCGPYHVQGTCAPVGSNGPCPCPCPKCSCVFPTADMGAEMQANQYKLNPNIRTPLTLDVPPSNPSKQSGTSITKIFNFKTPEKKDEKEAPKPSKKSVPPVLASLIYPYLPTLNSSHLANPKTKSSSPMTYSKSKTNSFHTRANQNSSRLSNKPMDGDTRKDRYIYYQKRYKATNPLDFNRVLMELRNKQSFCNNPKYKRTNPKPHVYSNFKPYDLQN